MRLAFDIETNGLLPELTTIHSLCIKHLDSGQTWSQASGSGTAILDGLKLLQDADYITGHNIIGYDIPAIQKLYPWFKPKGTVRDTLVMAKMIWPVDRLKDLDFPRWRAGTLPGQLIGAHKLEAWGYRMGRMKGEYSADVKDLSKEYAKHGDLEQVPEWARVLATVDDKGNPKLDPWLAWNQPMQDYCVQDVEVTEQLWKLIQGHFDGTGKAANGIGWSERSIDLEHRTWAHLMKQEARGYGFDKEAGVKLAAEIKTRQVELEEKLVAVFGSWWQPQDDPKVGHKPAREYSEKMTQFPDINVSRTGKNGKALKPYVGPPLCSYHPDAPFVRIVRTTFNPKSRQHLGDRLQDVFGWKPTEFGGKNGDQAKVDETTIQAIPESVLPSDLKELILEFLVNAKTLGQLADGNKSWIGLVKDDGCIHGRMDPLGTVSHRCAHFDPNIGQVPAVSKEKQPDGTETPIMGWLGGFGVECRKLWTPHPFRWQTGVDCSGLELRLLGHYLHPYDGGAFATRVSTPGLDIHAENAKITGLTRADTKTTTYAYLYGAGALKIGLGVGVPPEQIDELATSKAAQQYLGWLRKTMRNKFVMPDNYTLAHIMKGQQVKKAFTEGISGLKEMQKDLVERAQKDGFIVALDGRKLSIRKAHATLNQALQGGGAIVCKEWTLRTHHILVEDCGLVEDVDFGQCAYVHDEAQYKHRTEEMGPIIREASRKSVAWVTEELGLLCPLDTDGKSGGNWFDCH